jgi:hypothetical protein
MIIYLNCKNYLFFWSRVHYLLFVCLHQSPISLFKSPFSSTSHTVATLMLHAVALPAHSQALNSVHCIAQYRYTIELFAAASTFE